MNPRNCYSMNRSDRGQPTAWASSRAVEITLVFAGLQGRSVLLDTGHLRDPDLCQAGLDSRIAQIAANISGAVRSLRFGRGSLRHSAITRFAA